jgi:hypothetical protein
MPGLRRRGVGMACLKPGTVPEDDLDRFPAPRSTKAIDILPATAVTGDKDCGPAPGDVDHPCLHRAGDPLESAKSGARLLACAGRPSLEPDNGPGQEG